MEIPNRFSTSLITIKMSREGMALLLLLLSLSSLASAADDRATNPPTVADFAGVTGNFKKLENGVQFEVKKKIRILKMCSCPDNFQNWDDSFQTTIINCRRDNWNDFYQNFC